MYFMKENDSDLLPKYLSFGVFFRCGTRSQVGSFISSVIKHLFVQGTFSF